MTYKWKREDLIVEKKYTFSPVPESSGWKCYLYGNKDGNGLIYFPPKGNVPNWFVRWMMKVCLGCTWVKETK